MTRQSVIQEYVLITTFILLSLTVIEDCTCLAGCPLCSILLVLHVACNDDTTLDITSNHLEVNPFPEDENTASESGEELTKRGEYFGHPVGKRVSSFVLSLFYCLQSLQRRARRCPCFDLQNSQRSGAQNSLHCEKGPTLLISSHPLHSYHHTRRVSQRNTQNGLLVPPFPLNTILTINFATQPTGTKQIAALNGPLVIMLKKKNHHETMNLSILTPNPISFISKSKLTVVWRLKK